MSKKKNTLKDLDEFLKQQAATLVTPARLSETVEPKTPPQPVEPSQPETKPEDPFPEARVTKGSPALQKNELPVSAEKLLHDLTEFAKKEGDEFRNQFYDLIIKSVESQEQYSVEDKMLINTALYLKNGENWKDAIRDYWRKKARNS